MKTFVKILAPMLQALFIALKLCKVVDWSWWWVLSPAWIMATAVTLALVVAVFVVAYGERKASRRKPY